MMSSIGYYFRTKMCGALIRHELLPVLLPFNIIGHELLPVSHPITFYNSR